MRGTAGRAGMGMMLLAAVLAVVMPVGAAAQGAEAKSRADEAAERAAGLLVMGDLNRDGVADRVEAGPGALTVSLGQRDGGFKPGTALPVVGQHPRCVVAGDFNGDGWLDVVVGDEDGTVLLLVGDGVGGLTRAGEIAHLDSVVSIAVADFNHDGLPDLAISDAHGSQVAVLLGAGEGTFRGGWSFRLRMMGTSPHVAAADFNGDGNPDLAVVYDNDDGDTYDVMLGDGKGGFVPAPELGVVRDPNAHCVM